ncbi:hypothetical protein C8Q77DRAFT_1160329 [Trametes polyzona]|nr:hypothetical protein C8Q77DRAFT_1160329 [Trametes polyzona]
MSSRSALVLRAIDPLFATRLRDVQYHDHGAAGPPPPGDRPSLHEITQDDIPAPTALLFCPPSAQVIVRSANGTEYHVPRQVLVDASPILETMCDHIQAEGRVLELPDQTEEDVQLLLLLSHPLGPLPPPTSFEVAQQAIRLATKYQLRGKAQDRVFMFLRSWWHTKPLKVFVAAVKSEWPGLMQKAARESLRLTVRQVVECDELDEIPTPFYRRLIAHREECVGTAVALADNWRKAHTSSFSNFFGLCPRIVSADTSKYHWFHKLCDDLRAHILATPHPDTISAPTLDPLLERALRDAAHCEGRVGNEAVDFYNTCQCGILASMKLPPILKELSKAVEDKLAEISF